jgi:cell division ATPase FtsA
VGAGNFGAALSDAERTVLVVGDADALTSRQPDRSAGAIVADGSAAAPDRVVPSLPDASMPGGARADVAGIVEAVRGPAFSTGVGLALYAARTRGHDGIPHGNGSHSFWERTRTWLRGVLEG